jgi:hypothetical protein
MGFEFSLVTPLPQFSKILEQAAPLLTVTLCAVRIFDAVLFGDHGDRKLMV